SGHILSNVIHSQTTDHAPFGGVVPEIAARAHVELLDKIIARAMTESKIGFPDLDGVAAAAGPGLIGGVIVGLTTAKAIALVHRLPLLAVNHLEGHALTPRLIAPLAFPYLLFLASGGHTQLVAVQGVGRYTRLGTTVDDAIGEAFDKVAKLLGLPYPGGPHVEQAAGGVAANAALRAALEDVARNAGTALMLPPPALCTDNGAMIAWAGAERLALGMQDSLDATPRTRWRLDEATSVPAEFSNTRANF